MQKQARALGRNHSNGTAGNEAAPSSSRSARLATSTDLSAAEQNAVAEAVNPLIADAFAL